ncbi:hypothetical protein Rhe02_08120 [Rhizocola hellebori]|uniref:Uncharacterized protein n=1 Tax=Rhizocola hellebori TaxID=1392758 RepID=A0A8J3Q2Q5_9ACTN|nr:hypothetical protein [Rhizocola hellebori]GIH02745.1 hypothetical protein Rhe02_08120 [Rhizocola hellebori]
MDEIDIKGALRRYVTTGAPPFPLAASDLLAKGRQRQLLRVGLSCLGSGTMVIVTALVTSSALTNLSAPVHPGLQVPGCERSLPAQARPTASPTEPIVGYTSAPPVGSTSAPPVGFTSTPTVGTTSTPDYVEPSQYPTAESPSQFVGEPDLVPTQWPSVAPEGPLPRDVDPARLAAMACYVKGAALILFPNASFAPASEPPMEIARWPELNFTAGWQPTYSVRARVIDGRRNGIFQVKVAPLMPGTPPPQLPQLEVRRLGNGRTAYLDRGPFGGFVIVDTEHSSIAIFFDDLLTDDQALALATAPELDIFR